MPAENEKVNCGPDLTHCCLCFKARTGLILIGIGHILNFLFYTCMFLLGLGMTKGKDYLEAKDPKTLTADEKEGLDGLRKVWEAFGDMNPDMDMNLLFNISVAQAVISAIAAIFALIFFCSDSTASRFRMFASLILTIVVYNLNWVTFPYDMVNVVSTNLFNLYYLYVAFMYARQSTRSKQYNQL